jgi:hypothetical protein
MASWETNTFTTVVNTFIVYESIQNSIIYKAFTKRLLIGFSSSTSDALSYED